MSKQNTDMVVDIATILDDIEKPQLAMQSDKGSEIQATHFQHLLKSRGIHIFISEDDDIKCNTGENHDLTPPDWNEVSPLHQCPTSAQDLQCHLPQHHHHGTVTSRLWQYEDGIAQALQQRWQQPVTVSWTPCED